MTYKFTKSLRTKLVRFWLPEELWEELKTIANSEGLDVASFIRHKTIMFLKPRAFTED